MKANGQQAQQQAAEQGQQDRLLARHVEMDAAQIEPGGGKRNTRIQLTTEDQRNIVTENIPENAAKDPGDHPAYGRH
ncbi:hypothetical protein D3C79_1095570 [compost metagenome]